MNKIKTFKEVLISAYKVNPCGVQATALWKTLEKLKDYEIDFEVEDDKILRLEIWKQNDIYLKWNRNNEINISRESLEDINFMLLHDRHLVNIPKDMFNIKVPYFRLMFNDKVKKIEVPKEFEIVNVNIETELEEVSKFICNCYENIKPDVNEVKKWTRHKVFNKDLWVWIIDKTNNRPAGLGIAELDNKISEGSLEWIQISSDYRGKGLGKVIVQELLNRLIDKVDFITVSGEVDNNSNPEKLYRNCGFKGNDIWWVLRK